VTAATEGQLPLGLGAGEALNAGHCPSCRWQPTKDEMRSGKLCRHPEENKRGFWDRHPDSYKHCWAYEQSVLGEKVKE